MLRDDAALSLTHDWSKAGFDCHRGRTSQGQKKRGSPHKRALERGRIRLTRRVLSPPQAHAHIPGREGVHPHPCPAGGRGATPRLRDTRRRRCAAYRARRASRARRRGSCGEEKRQAAARVGGRTTPSPVSQPPLRALRRGPASHASPELPLRQHCVATGRVFRDS